VDTFNESSLIMISPWASCWVNGEVNKLG
jgi:hypothetical protein